jgi:outer membrane receptor for ferrienterochelin and colicins
MNIKKLLGIAILSGIASGSFAQTEAKSDSVDIYALSLEELMSITVVSSTKTEMSIQKAPSVIRLFTKEDIKRNGFQTLREVLDQVPGFEIQEYRAGHQLTWVRGVQSRYNNKVLLLIDGVPMRDSYYGNFNVDEMIPVEIIERVEIINGPGSVLYGTNSFSGVISVTTKRQGKSVAVDGGTFNSYSANAQYDYKGFFANANVFKTDGFSPDLNSDGKVRQHDQTATNQAFFASYENKGLQLIGSFTNYEYPYKYRDSKGEYRFKRTPVYGAASYNIDLSKNSSLKLRGFYNNFGFEIDKTKFVDATSTEVKERAMEYLNSSLYGADIEYFLKHSRNEIAAGVSLLNDHADDIHAVVTQEAGTSVNIEEPMIVNGKSSFTRSTVGLFLQDTYTLSKIFNFTGGIRYDILSNFDSQFNYRVGLTGSFTENWYGKLLYGTAYRIPSYREYLDATSYNNDLKPEHLKTIELQFGYVSNKIDINVTLYNNNYTDFISEIVVDSIGTAAGIREIDDEVSFNFDSRNITGLELNTVLKPTSKLNFLLGLSYKINATEELGGFRSTDEIVYTSQEINFSKRDLIFMSRFTGNFAVNYSFGARARVNLSGQYFSDRKTPGDYQADVPEEVQNKGNADGFVRMNFYGSVNIYKGLSANINVYNLFDSNNYSGPFGGQTEYDAQWTGRTVRAGLMYSF